MNTISLDLAARCLIENIKTDTPAMLWGPPGVGKSEVIDQVGVALKMPVIDFRASLRDQVDLRGLPIVDAKAGTTRWLPPAELPNVKKHGPKGILKLDELNTASMSVMAACFGLVLERRLGEYELPPGWVPIAAGNRISDRAAAQRMPTALQNRFAHYEVAAEHKTWYAWATRMNLSPMVVAFIRYRPALLHAMPEDGSNSFPTPRSWVKVAKHVNSPDDLRMHLVSAIVGRGAAAEFEAFFTTFRDIPTIAEILKEPKNARLPGEDEPSKLCAIATALARHATKQNFGAVLTYAKRLPKSFEVITAADAVEHKPELKETKAFGTWFVENKEWLA